MTLTDLTLGDAPGEMGDNLPFVDLGEDRTATAVATGPGRACAILAGGAVKCWGTNSGGYLGVGNKDATIGDAPSEVGDSIPLIELGAGSRASAIAIGPNHTCAILDPGTVKCWGFNGSGQLGLGDTETRGDEPGEMGDALPTVDLGSKRTAKAITAGNGFTCVVLDDDTVKCWGNNQYWGQLGLGDGETRGDEPNEMGDALPTVDLGRGLRAKAIAAGHYFACALLTDDSVKCWGSERFLGLGKLPNITPQDAVVGDEPGEMGDALPSLDFGQGRTVIAIAATGGVEHEHACAVLNDGVVKCWGDNKHGELGLGDTEFRNEVDDAAIDLGTDAIAVAVTTGGGHSCALLKTDVIKCWGGGALGLGDREARGDEPGEMGDDLPGVELGTR